MPQTCPYCRESIPPSDLAECPACRTPHHHDCWAENGGCTVFGCEHAPNDDPKIAVASHELAGTAWTPSYFLARNGQQYGPYTLDTLRHEAQRGAVSRSDLAWTEGLANWVPVSQILGATPLAPQFQTPVSAPAILHAAADDPCAGRLRFGRRIYMLSFVAASFLTGALSNSPETETLGVVLFWCLFAPASVLRARDVGMSGWTVLLFLVPIGNLFVAFRLLLAPRGYAITGKTDTFLRVMTWVFFGLLALIVLALVIRVATEK